MYDVRAAVLGSFALMIWLTACSAAGTRSDASGAAPTALATSLQPARPEMTRGAEPTAPSGATREATDPVLVQVVASGGRCPYGVCQSALVVHASGVYTITEGPTVLHNAILDTPQLTALRHQIEQTDFTRLRTHPVTGPCAAAVDGQEWVFTFHTSHGVETISNCTVTIDPTLGIFILITKLWPEAAQAAQ